MVPILRSQNEIETEIESLVDNDARWTAAKIYRAMNQALSTWANRVQVPYYHAVDWVAGTHAYSLPDYIDGPIDPQARPLYSEYTFALNGTDNTDDRWVDIMTYNVSASATGGQTLILGYSSQSDTGRILWWGRNGPIPTSIPVLNTGISHSSTSLTLTTKPRVGRSGFVKIGSEWMQYAGTVEANTTLTLLNLVRGVAGTAAVGHSAGASVYWGIAVDRDSLWEHLNDYTIARMMYLFLMNPQSAQADHYAGLYRDAKQSADMFWRTYVPLRPPKARLSWTPHYIGNSYVVGTTPTTTPTPDINVVCDGDSLTYGAGVTPATQSYPAQLATLLGTAYTVTNKGVSSQTLTDMIADAVTDIDPLIDRTTTNILCAWAGTNDLYFGDTAAVAYADYVAYCQARQAAGWKVVAFTILPRSDTSTPVDFETSRQTFNTNVRAYYTTFANALADVAADSRIGDDNDEQDTTYYHADLVHMTVAGYGIIAATAETAIEVIV